MARSAINASRSKARIVHCAFLQRCFLYTAVQKWSGSSASVATVLWSCEAVIVTGKVQTAYTSYNNRKQGGAEPPSYNIGGATAPPAPMIAMPTHT